MVSCRSGRRIRLSSCLHLYSNDVLQLLNTGQPEIVSNVVAVAVHRSTPLHRPHSTSMPKTGYSEAIKQAAMHHHAQAYSVGNTDTQILTILGGENEGKEGKYSCF